jgi:hypothetical protein
MVRSLDLGSLTGQLPTSNSELPRAQRSTLSGERRRTSTIETSFTQLGRTGRLGSWGLEIGR